LIGGHFESSCEFNTIVSINGFDINFVIQNVELLVMVAGNGLYSFNITDLTSSSCFTISFPN